MDFRRAAGSPPLTTMRGHLRALDKAGIVDRRRQPDFPGSVDLELARAGRDLLTVSRVLRAWLLESPSGPLELGSPAAKSALKALVDGWSSGVVRVLAAKPQALTDVSRIITGLSYPSLERRLGAMRLNGLIEPCPGSGRGTTPYRLTDWMRRAVGPLAAAARWERTHLPEETMRIRPIDIESAFLLVVPLITLTRDQTGVCRLAVEITHGSESRQAGVLVSVDEGRIQSCVTRLDGSVDASAVGSVSAWIDAMLEGAGGRLELSGQRRLAAAFGMGMPAAMAFDCRPASQRVG
jgi:DNA-binding HxlR family transcriptional regulator